MTDYAQVEAGGVGAIRIVLLDQYGNAVLQPSLQLAGSLLMGPAPISALEGNLW